MSSAFRARFTDASINTVTPARIIVMCFERIDRDLEMTEAAMHDGNRQLAHELCCHSQEIINELLGSIDQAAWEHSKNLAALYSWALTQLAAANMRQQPDVIAEVRAVLAELREAFSHAALPQASSTSEPRGAEELVSRG
jgi:flagellar protein FliS